MSHTSSTHHSPLRWLVLRFEDWIAARHPASERNLSTSRDERDFESELITRLEDGYFTEDTGRFVNVPDFITRQVKARLETGDWC